MTEWDARFNDRFGDPVTTPVPTPTPTPGPVPTHATVIAALDVVTTLLAKIRIDIATLKP